MTAAVGGAQSTTAGSTAPAGTRNAIAGAVAVGVAYVGLVDPARGVFPMCPFHAVTGLWCPGCGATRAAHALLHGHVVTALHDNVLLVLAVPFALAWSWRWFLGRADRLPRVPVAVTCWLPAALVVFGLLRNLPAFGSLAPLG
ncbi:MAG: DUF2752 domain-containing protein [Acidimicrobiia bacterium]